jgi:4-hydroxy-tetrahydrodipicolinate reductase
VRYALVGYGRMGRAIELAAGARGHARVAIVDTGARGRSVARAIEPARFRGVEVAFEFTAADSAKANVLALLARGVPVVCGTTGWDASEADLARAVRASRGALLVAPNFSVGMAVFARVVREAAGRLAAAGGYDPWVVEWHHRGKKDAPSGTALRLAGLVAAGAAPAAAVHRGMPASPLPPGTVHVASVRAGHEPGRHEVGWDGADDRITLTHEARGRAGFARGAVLAAEWLRGRRGRYTFEDAIDDLLRAPGRKPGRGGRR